MSGLSPVRTYSTRSHVLSAADDYFRAPVLEVADVVCFNGPGSLSITSFPFHNYNDFLGHVDGKLLSKVEEYVKTK